MEVNSNKRLRENYVGMSPALSKETGKKLLHLIGVTGNEHGLFQSSHFLMTGKNIYYKNKNYNHDTTYIHTYTK